MKVKRAGNRGIEARGSGSLGSSVPRPLASFSDPAEPVLGLPIARAGAMLPADLLQGDETILLLLKPSPFYIILACLETLAVIGAIAVMSLWLQRRYEAHWFDERAMLTLCGVLAMLRVSWQFLEWMSRTYVLTDRRVIRFMGVFRVQMFQAELRRLQHTELLWTVRERAFGLGSISLSTAGRTIPEAYWVMLARPVAVHRKILAAINRYGR